MRRRESRERFLPRIAFYPCVPRASPNLQRPSWKFCCRVSPRDEKNPTRWLNHLSMVTVMIFVRRTKTCEVMTMKQIGKIACFVYPGFHLAGIYCPKPSNDPNNLEPMHGFLNVWFSNIFLIVMSPLVGPFSSTMENSYNTLGLAKNTQISWSSVEVRISCLKSTVTPHVIVYCCLSPCR